MDRLGNILWRNFGDDVFLITMHRPWERIVDGKAVKNYPLKGLVDCAASKIGNPVAFDVVGSPFAGLVPEPDAYYALGHPGFQFQLMTDGYIWQKPLAGYEGVTLIPLKEIAPDSKSMAEVIASNPFPGDKMTALELETLWGQEAVELQNLPTKFKWNEFLAEDPCAE